MMVEGMGDMGLSLSLAAVGSALGSGVAAMGAIGVMKRKLAEGQKAPFTLFIFVGAPLSQLFYGMIFDTNLMAANLPPESYLFQVLMGLGAGLAIGASAFLQGRAGARACDALGETGKGLGGYIMAIGIIESVALLVMILLMLKIPKVPAAAALIEPAVQQAAQIAAAIT